MRKVSRLFSKIHDKRDRAMFNVVYKYGLRASEVGLLKIDDVGTGFSPIPAAVGCTNLP